MSLQTSPVYFHSDDQSPYTTSYFGSSERSPGVDSSERSPGDDFSPRSVEEHYEDERYEKSGN